MLRGGKWGFFIPPTPWAARWERSIAPGALGGCQGWMLCERLGRRGMRGSKHRPGHPEQEAAALAAGYHPRHLTPLKPRRHPPVPLCQPGSY